MINKNKSMNDLEFNQICDHIDWVWFRRIKSLSDKISLNLIHRYIFNIELTILIPQLSYPQLIASSFRDIRLYVSIDQSCIVRSVRSKISKRTRGKRSNLIWKSTVLCPENESYITIKNTKSATPLIHKARTQPIASIQ